MRSDMDFSPQNYDTLLKIVIVGNSDVGKTTLLSRLASGEYRTNLTSTVGRWCSRANCIVGCRVTQDLHRYRLYDPHSNSMWQKREVADLVCVTFHRCLFASFFRRM